MKTLHELCEAMDVEREQQAELRGYLHTLKVTGCKPEDTIESQLQLTHSWVRMERLEKCHDLRMVAENFTERKDLPEKLKACKIRSRTHPWPRYNEDVVIFADGRKFDRCECGFWSCLTRGCALCPDCYGEFCECEGELAW